MADYPDDIYTERVTENLPGLVYDPADKKNLYSEDFQHHAEEIIAIETALGTNPEGAYASVKAWLTALAEAISGIVVSFLDLSDTPSSYTDQAGKVVAVNTAEDALEFIDPPSGGGGDWETISKIVLSSDSTTLCDITGISSDYKLFRVSFSIVNGGGAFRALLQLNGDTASHYVSQVTRFYSTTVNDSTTMEFLRLNWSYASSSSPMVCSFTLGKPSAGSKALLIGHTDDIDNDQTVAITTFFGGSWSDTSELIDEIKIFTDAGDFGAGSICLIEGVKSV